MDEAEVEEFISEHLGFRLACEKDGVSLFEDVIDFAETQQNSLQLLAVGNHQKLFAVSNTKNIGIGSLRDLDAGNDPKGGFHVVPLEKTTHIRLDATNTKLYVVADGVFYTANVADIIAETSEVFSEVARNVVLVEPSPSQDDLYYYLTASSEVVISTGTTVPNVSAASWDASGKFVCVVTYSSFKVFSTAGEEIGSYENINATDLWAVAAVDIHNWLTADNNPEEDDPILRLVTKDESDVSQKVVLVSPPFGEAERAPALYTASLSDWVIGKTFTFVTSALSTEIATVETSSEDPLLVSQLNDVDRAELPMDDSGDDTLPVGLAIDLSGTDVTVKEPCMGIDEAEGVLPRLLCLNNRGNLLMWHVFDSSGLQNNTLSLQRALENRSQDSIPERKAAVTKPAPADKPAPFVSSGFGSTDAKPALFGSTGFGSTNGKQAPFGSSGFGSTDAKPFGGVSFGSSKTASNSGFGKSSFGAAGFGKSSFGNSALGNMPLSSQTTSSFGSYATSSSPFASLSKASESPFGALATATPSTIGDIFNESSNSKDSLSGTPNNGPTASPLEGFKSAPPASFNLTSKVVGSDVLKDAPLYKEAPGSDVSLKSTSFGKLASSSSPPDVKSPLAKQAASLFETETESLLDSVTDLGNSLDGAVISEKRFPFDLRTETDSPFGGFKSDPKPSFAATNGFGSFMSTEQATQKEEKQVSLGSAQSIPRTSDLSQQPEAISTDEWSDEDESDLPEQSSEVEDISLPPVEQESRKAEKPVRLESPENVPAEKPVRSESPVSVAKPDEDLSVLSTEEEEEEEEEVLDFSSIPDIEFGDLYYFAGFTSTFQSPDHEVSKKIMEVIQNTHANLQVLTTNAGVMENLMEVCSYDKVILGEEELAYPRLWTMGSISDLAKTAQGTAEIMGDVLLAATEQDEKLLSLLLKLEESEVERANFDRLLSQVAVYKNYMNSSIKKRPLEMHAEVLRLNLRKKLAKVKNLLAEVLKQMIPFGLKKDFDSGMLSKLDRVVYEINAKAKKYLDDVVLIEREITKLVKNGLEAATESIESTTGSFKTQKWDLAKRFSINVPVQKAD